ncbi:MAG: hypothetical protein J7518_20270 [Nocardioidaceae bacterium]|nr:hypothetical protein [Nocardioidaceae bacterium]
MNRRVMRLGAIIGAFTVTTLAVAPAFAAAPVSQASARSIQLKIAGNNLVSQETNASNDGSSEAVSVDNTIPELVSLIPGNNALSAGVGVQKAQANKNGTSFACAGVAGAGGGLVTVGNSECKVDGKPLTLGLGNLNLGLDDLLGGNGAITSALGTALAPVLDALGPQLNTVLSTLTGSLADAGLDIGISGGLSAVEATCTANPTAAQGKAEIADTSGDHKIPITLHLPNNTNLVLANLDVDHPGKPGGTDVLVELDSVIDTLVAALSTQITTMLGGALAGLDPVLKAIVQPLQAALIKPLVDALEPALKAISDNILKIVVNDVTPGDGGRSVSVTTLRLEVLGAVAQFTGSSLVSGTIGHVTCGPNRAPVVTPPGNPENPQNPENPEVPTVVDSGVAGHGDHTARNILLATGALMLLAGSAGLVGFRRSLLNK